MSGRRRRGRERLCAPRCGFVFYRAGLNLDLCAIECAPYWNPARVFPVYVGFRRMPCVHVNAVETTMISTKHVFAVTFRPYGPHLYVIPPDCELVLIVDIVKVLYVRVCYGEVPRRSRRQRRCDLVVYGARGGVAYSASLLPYRGSRVSGLFTDHCLGQ